MKKLLSTFLALTLLLSLCAVPAFAGWDGVSATEFDGGSGTRTAPYLISTAAQLALFRDKVNGGQEQICAKITDNVDLGFQDWNSIGLSASGYTGIFDGGGYAIQNLKISSISSGTKRDDMIVYGGGLFGIVGAGGIVKCVNVDGVVSIKETVSVDPDIGAICGGNFGTIEECFSTCSFRDFELNIAYAAEGGRTTIGGIAGVNEGTIKNCYAVGTMEVKVTYEGALHPIIMGGIIGRNYEDADAVTNCYSAVSMRVDTNTTSYIGGIEGEIVGTSPHETLYTDASRCGKLTGKGALSNFKSSAALPTADMKTADFVKTMGSAFIADTKNVNEGYPILAVMAYDETSDSSVWFDDELDSNVAEEALFIRLTPAELSQRDLTKAISRAEFCAVAVKLYEELGGTDYDPAGLENPFTDTNSDAVIKAYHIGVTNGTSATTFNPYASISRQDMAAMLTRVYKARGLSDWTLATDSAFTLDDSGVTPFDDDSAISAYAKSAVYFLVKNGILKGVSDKKFAPLNQTASEEAIGYANATREQAIILSIRMFTKFA